MVGLASKKINDDVVNSDMGTLIDNIVTDVELLVYESVMDLNIQVKHITLIHTIAKRLNEIASNNQGSDAKFVNVMLMSLQRLSIQIENYRNGAIRGVPNQYLMSLNEEFKMLHLVITVLTVMLGNINEHNNEKDIQASASVKPEVDCVKPDANTNYWTKHYVRAKSECTLNVGSKRHSILLLKGNGWNQRQIAVIAKTWEDIRAGVTEDWVIHTIDRHSYDYKDSYGYGYKDKSTNLPVICVPDGCSIEVLEILPF